MILTVTSLFNTLDSVHVLFYYCTVCARQCSLRPGVVTALLLAFAAAESHSAVGRIDLPSSTHFTPGGFSARFMPCKLFTYQKRQRSEEGLTWGVSTVPLLCLAF